MHDSKQCILPHFYKKCLLLTFWSQSLSKYYLRIQSIPQREHNISLLQRSIC
jgi:hypothetical protein